MDEARGTPPVVPAGPQDRGVRWLIDDSKGLDRDPSRRDLRRTAPTLVPPNLEEPDLPTTRARPLPIFDLL